MLPGFNHNISYKDRVFHIQTEDSGSDNPHVITHLFMGGNIIASQKTSYADIIGQQNLLELVREIMERQHKYMLKKLINGGMDARLGLEPGKPKELPHEVKDTATPVPPAQQQKAPAPKHVQAPQKPLQVQPATQKQPASPKPQAPLPAKPAASPPRLTALAPAGKSKSAPAETAAQSKPGGGLFDNILSEKSLDEVILSFLAEEMPKDKK
jgi:hypothetical protein